MTSGASGGAGWRRLGERLTGTPRLVLAVVLVAAGTLVALTSTTPPATAPVLVAVRQVAAGAAVRADDVEVARRSSSDLPDGALTAVDDAVGHRAVSTLARGEVVSAVRLAPRGLLVDLEPGRALATVSVAPDRVGVVSVGDTVRVVVAGTDPPFEESAASASSAPTILSDDARVLAAWPPPGDSDAATVVLDVDVGSASRLAALSADLLVGLVIVTA